MEHRRHVLISYLLGRLVVAAAEHNRDAAELPLWGVHTSFGAVRYTPYLQAKQQRKC